MPPTRLARSLPRASRRMPRVQRLESGKHAATVSHAWKAVTLSMLATRNIGPTVKATVPELRTADPGRESRDTVPPPHAEALASPESSRALAAIRSNSRDRSGLTRGPAPWVNTAVATRWAAHRVRSLRCEAAATALAPVALAWTRGRPAARSSSPSTDQGSRKS